MDSTKPNLVFEWVGRGGSEKLVLKGTALEVYWQLGGTLTREELNKQEAKIIRLCPNHNVTFEDNVVREQGLSKI